jgi:hypothetical protein
MTIHLRRYCGPKNGSRSTVTRYSCCCFRQHPYSSPNRTNLSSRRTNQSNPINRSITLQTIYLDTTNNVQFPHPLPPRARRTHPQHHHPPQAPRRRPTLQHHPLKKRQRRDRGQEPGLDTRHPQKGPAGCAVCQQQGGERVSKLGPPGFEGLCNGGLMLMCFEETERRTSAVMRPVRRTR